ncbi:hypothetical protein D3C76_759850 [compost metagenome]
MLRIHWRQNTPFDPAAQAFDVAPGLGVQQVSTFLGQVLGAQQQLIAEHLCNVRVLPGDTNPRLDVGRQAHQRVVALAQHRRGFQQRLDKPEQHLGVEVFFALEVIVQVGFRHAGPRRNVASLGGVEAPGGKFRAGGLQDQLLVVLANTAHGDFLAI